MTGGFEDKSDAVKSQNGVQMTSWLSEHAERNVKFEDDR